jgi:RNA polymerase sigma-70 factor (ECF subfamily)
VTRRQAAPRLADLERMEALYRESYPAVLRVCINRLGDERDAEDAAQEVFSRAVDRADQLKEHALPWLLLVARNICTDELRRRRAPASSLEDEDGEELHRSTAIDPADEVVGRIRVRELLARLTQAERKVITEKWLLDRTHEEASDQLGITSGTTRQLVRRARKRLIAYLKEHEGLELGALLAGLLGAARRSRARRAVVNRELTPQLVAWAQPVVAFTVPMALLISSPGAPVEVLRAAPPPQLAMAASSAPDRGPATCVTSACGVVSTAGTAKATAPAGSRTAAGVPNHTSVGALVPGMNGPSIQYFRADDAAASPNFASDHTLLVAGVDTSCPTAQCPVIWRSGDAGHSWTLLQGAGLQGTQLFLPKGGFSAQRFYAFGSQGLQRTTDGGATFVPLLATAEAYASLAPDASGWEVIVSNTAIWGVGANTQSQILAALPPGFIARGKAALVREGGQWHAIQAAAQPGSNPVEVLDCGPSGCSTDATLPWMAGTDLTISAAGSGLMLASSTAGVATSTDLGHTWRVLPGLGSSINGAVLADVTNRIVVILKSGGRQGEVVFTDDFGSTWQSAQGSPGSAQLVRQLRGPELFAVDGANAAATKFYCSSDTGSNWSTC